jgi:lipopolysaccharide export system permease protein
VRFEFFPSRTLTLYLARLFITRILAVLVMLVMVLQTLDLLGKSGDILAYPGNGEAELWHYISLRFPQLIAQFLPYSVLLATLLTFWPLNQNSEVIAMRAAGLSAHQVLAPLVLTAMIVAGVSFAFNERVLTRASATLKAWSDAEYGPIPEDSGVRSNVYFADGSDILTAQTMRGAGDAIVMEGVTFYHRDSRGMITEQYRSSRAEFAAPGWRLEAPTRFEVQLARTEEIAPIVVATGLTPEQVTISGVNGDGQNAFELSRSIDLLDRNGRRTDELVGKWWHKFSGPLSAVLMPLLGAVAAFGLARSGQLFIRAVIGMALGFSYFVVDNAALAMGNFGGYPPLLAAWAPFLLFALVGETVLLRTEE